MIILDGKVTQKSKESILKYKIEQYAKRKPRLVVIQVGDDGASSVYVNNKKKACERVGIDFIHFEIPTHVLQEDIEAVIKNYNDDKEVDGIIVQLPILCDNPINTRKILDTIDPTKDVDGLTTYNFGNLLTEQYDNGFIPCTAKGVFNLLNTILNKSDYRGKNVLIIGKGLTSGRPLVPMFMNLGANVVNISSGCSKEDLVRYATKSDIIISCVGKQVIYPHMLKADSILINVGMRREDGKIKGDYDLDLVLNYGYGYAKTPKAVSTIVGSTGILTVTNLLENVYLAYERNMENI